MQTWSPGRAPVRIRLRLVLSGRLARHESSSAQGASPRRPLRHGDGQSRSRFARSAMPTRRQAARPVKAELPIASEVCVGSDEHQHSRHDWKAAVSARRCRSRHESEAGPRATCLAQRRSAGKQQSRVSAAGRSKRQRQIDRASPYHLLWMMQERTVRSRFRACSSALCVPTRTRRKSRMADLEVVRDG